LKGKKAIKNPAQKRPGSKAAFFKHAAQIPLPEFP